jgi:four helix bundle protein
MEFGHEKLDVYRLSLRYVAWANDLADRLKGQSRFARDQLLRASQSIPLNIAEGNGKGTEADRRRFFEIARGSALECAAIQDVLEVCSVIDLSKNREGKNMILRIVSMLTKLGRREYRGREDSVEYGVEGGGNDKDNDYDYDNDDDNESIDNDDESIDNDNDDDNDNDNDDDNDDDNDKFGAVG